MYFECDCQIVTRSTAIGCGWNRVFVFANSVAELPAVISQIDYHRNFKLKFIELTSDYRKRLAEFQQRETEMK